MEYFDIGIHVKEEKPQTSNQESGPSTNIEDIVVGIHFKEEEEEKPSPMTIACAQTEEFRDVKIKDMKYTPC
jgi:hypothetical protein